MGRHQAPVPPERRLFGAALGITTIVVLGALLWFVATRPTSPFDDVDAAPPPSTTSFPSTTETSVFPSTTADLPTTTQTSSTTTTRPPTTTTTRPPTTTRTRPPITTTTSDPGPPPLVLGPDGLGPAALGDPIDEVVAIVEERLGGATEDTGWISSDSELGLCPGSVVRVIRWRSLRLFFSDGPTAYGEETPHLFYYNNNPADTDEVVDIPTARGIGLGSSVADLEEAYGDAVTVESSIAFGPAFVVDPRGPGILSGTVTLASEAGEVTSIAGGFGCGT